MNDIFVDAVANIKNARKQIGFTQSALAEAVGMTTRSISRYETVSYFDQLSPCKINRLSQICEYLNVPFVYKGEIKVKKDRNVNNMIFGEKVEHVSAILFYDKWYENKHGNALEFFHDPHTAQYYFSFWQCDKNRIGNAERITGKISKIQAVAAD
tara:strand:+ start:46 stop:510 length:465 start_codon:yes stop_codon:yes gene_type:complete